MHQVQITLCLPNRRGWINFYRRPFASGQSFKAVMAALLIVHACTEGRVHFTCEASTKLGLDASAWFRHEYARWNRSRNLEMLWLLRS